MLDEPSAIIEDTESIITSNVDETTNREPLSESSVVEEKHRSKWTEILIVDDD